MARRFINYPTNRLLAVFDEPEAARSVIPRLLEAGVASASIELLEGERDADRLDGLGASNGPFGRLLRAIQFMSMDQMPDFLLYETALRSGRSVLAIREPDGARRRAAIAILKDAGAHFINWYGRLSTEEISLWHGPEPEIAGIWRR